MGGRSSKAPSEANGHSRTEIASQDLLQDSLAALHNEPILSLCVGNETELYSAGVDKDVLLYSWARHIKRARFKGPSKDITKVVYSSNHGVVYAASRDRSVYVWKWPREKPEEKSERSTTEEPISAVPEENVLVAEPMATLQGHSLGVTALAQSEAFPQLLCSGSRDNSVCLWDTKTNKSISSMYAPRNLVTGLEWLEGERAVLQSSEDKTLRVWDLGSCSTVQHFRARKDLQTCCAVSSSGQQFLAGSSGSGHLGAGLTLWDRRNERRPVREFKGHSEGVQDCIFTTVDDRELIASAGDDSTVRLWDKNSGDCLHTEFLTGAGPITSLTSPSAGLIACSSFKEGVSVWTVNAGGSSLSIRAKY